MPQWPSKPPGKEDSKNGAEPPKNAVTPATFKGVGEFEVWLRVACTVHVGSYMHFGEAEHGAADPMQWRMSLNEQPNAAEPVLSCTPGHWLIFELLQLSSIQAQIAV